MNANCLLFAAATVGLCGCHREDQRETSTSTVGSAVPMTLEACAKGGGDAVQNPACKHASDDNFKQFMGKGPSPMNTSVADHFLDTFTRYIDSGFGLLGGEVAFVATTLVAIDVTIAALFWAWSSGDDIIARLIKKTLYVGFFAFLITNWNALARVIFESFSGLG